MKKNITYIISNINKSFSFEWIFSDLNKEKFNLSVILLNAGDSELERFLNEKKIKIKRIKYNGKKDVLKAIFITYLFLKKNKTTIVHTHLFDANIIGLIASLLAGIKKRVYTRHHSNFHYIYHPETVKYDKLINKISTDIVAISNVVKEVLIKKEGVNVNKIHLIHHGFKLEKFEHVSQNTVNELKLKYNPCDTHPVIGVIARYEELKGIQYIIPAFKKILIKYPNALLILANTNGNYASEIKKILTILPEKNYIEILFESDIFSLYKVFDLYTHVPIAKEIEAFGQTYIEALASGIPSVFTLSGIANEFIINNHNALVVDYQNSDAIYGAWLDLLLHPEMKNELILNGKNDVNAMFQLDKMILKLERLYDK